MSMSKTVNYEEVAETSALQPKRFNSCWKTAVLSKLKQHKQQAGIMKDSTQTEVNLNSSAVEVIVHATQDVVDLDSGETLSSIEQDMDVTSASESNGTPNQGGRGRPRKPNHLLKQPRVEDRTVTNRGRGRPRKNDSATPKEVSSKGRDSPTKTAGKQENPTEIRKKAIPKTTGRGRTSKTVNPFAKPKVSSEKFGHGSLGRPRLPDDELKQPREKISSGLSRGRPLKPDHLLKHPRVTSETKVSDRGRGRPRLPDHLLMQPRGYKYVAKGLPLGRPRKPDHKLKHPRASDKPKVNSKGRGRPRKPDSELKHPRVVNSSEDTGESTDMGE